MYLGKATFYQERMNDFLNVAKALEIKEISNNVVDEDSSNITTEETDYSESQDNTKEDTFPESIIRKTAENIGSRKNQSNNIQPKYGNKYYPCSQCEKIFKDTKRV